VVAAAIFSARPAAAVQVGRVGRARELRDPPAATCRRAVTPMLARSARYAPAHLRQWAPCILGAANPPYGLSAAARIEGREFPAAQEDWFAG
jgi:hypothetical protein